ncbi:hypothetical protein [Azospirillum sp. sgz301742]
MANPRKPDVSGKPDDPSALVERFRAAKARRSVWEAHWQDCYDYKSSTMYSIVNRSA